MNRHKDMKLIKIWLTDAEVKGLIESLKIKMPNTIADIIMTSDDRRDILWK
jgi:hypothetical protein